MQKMLTAPHLFICILFLTNCESDDSIIDDENSNVPITELPTPKNPYTIVDTNVLDFYSNTSIISIPSEGQNFYGQDANYLGNKPSYTNNNNGTITDNVTGLMWEQDMGSKITFETASTKASNSTLEGYTDWRVPTIKELYSLIQFTGQVKRAVAIEFFIDTNYFNQLLGDTSIGEREIDAQTWTSTEYVGKTMNNDATVFGVNFVDDRIKGIQNTIQEMEMPIVCILEWYEEIQIMGKIILLIMEMVPLVI